MTENVERPTFEQAKLCPQCKQPGVDEKTIPIPREAAIQANIQPGAKLHQIKCLNPNCDFGVWLVQVNKDGSIPDPTDHTGKPKHYVGFEGHDQMARDIRRQLEREAAQQVIPGAEIRRPRMP